MALMLLGLCCGEKQAGGKEVQCAWLVDKFGLSWQILPANIGQLTSNPDPIKAGRVMLALHQFHIGRAFDHVRSL
jgi:predicted 3-demethylubiquinone-9 3-methyltransferase (glyoxalase superfamily)